jgi:hypothetical protein
MQPGASRPVRALTAAGKTKKLALTACMHKLLTILNAMVKHHTRWMEPVVLVR